MLAIVAICPLYLYPLVEERTVVKAEILYHIDAFEIEEQYEVGNRREGGFENGIIYKNNGQYAYRQHKTYYYQRLPEYMPESLRRARKSPLESDADGSLAAYHRRQRVGKESLSHHIEQHAQYHNGNDRPPTESQQEQQIKADTAADYQYVHRQSKRRLQQSEFPGCTLLLDDEPSERTLGIARHKFFQLTRRRDVRQ